MKKILSLLGTITLIETSTTNLIACNKPQQYTLKKLSELKEENNKIINDNKLEWMAPQEKPFNNIDNKWYFVVWRIDNGHDWRIVKFKNDKYLDPYLIEEKILDEYSTYNLKLKVQAWPDLVANKNIFYHFWWELDDGSHFKAVYRWEGKDEPDKLVIDLKTGKITDLNEVKEDKEEKR